MTSPNPDPTQFEVAGHKVRASGVKQFGLGAMLLAALGSSGGVVGTIQALDLFGVKHRDGVIVGLQLEKVDLQARLDAEREQGDQKVMLAIEDQRAICHTQIEVLAANVVALRGQNCEHLRASGALLDDANCWGME